MPAACAECLETLEASPQEAEQTELRVRHPSLRSQGTGLGSVRFEFAPSGSIAVPFPVSDSEALEAKHLIPTSLSVSFITIIGRLATHLYSSQQIDPEHQIGRG